MTLIKFAFQWMDDSHRVMVYRAESDWNWKDFHTVVRVSTFSMNQAEGWIESVIDLRTSTRAEMPRGLPAHVRTFGKKNHERLSGRAIVIGLPHKHWEELQLNEDNTLTTPDGYVKFVQTDDELHAVLADWSANPPE